VQGTPGAELHASLDRAKVDVVVDKAQNPNTQGYSSFHGGNLADVLRERGVDRVFVAGLATDYCVKNTVLDARRLGLEVTVVGDAVRGIDVEPGDSERALEEMRRTGADFTTSEALLAERSPAEARR
jgi:nicotinamidase/pyrazinamidase